jgi:hypothetical protein
MTAHPKQAELEQVSDQQVLLHLEFARNTTHRIKSKAIVRGRGEPRHTGVRSVAKHVARHAPAAGSKAIIQSGARSALSGTLPGPDEKARCGESLRRRGQG